MKVHDKGMASSLNPTFDGDDGGFISLEELDGDVSMELDFDSSLLNTKRAKKRKRGIDDKKGDDVVCIQKNTKRKKSKGKKADHDGKGKGEITLPSEIGQELDLQTAEEMSAWTELRLHPLLIKAIAKLGFRKPTAIQRACIPVAAHQGRDVIGAAETGSGKTLAFGLPILQRLLEEQEKNFGHITQDQKTVDTSARALRALIVSPTRELALQICNHIRALTTFTNIMIVPIVGGMSSQKQQRLLKRKPQIIVGTPGRLWELMNNGETHLLKLNSLSFFVLDEADRMIEKGHFHELQSIIDMLPQKCNMSSGHVEVEVNDIEKQIDIPKEWKKRQTLVFSATLSLPHGFKKKLKQGLKSRREASSKGDYNIAMLSQKAGVSHKVAIIDLTSESVVAHKLEESVIQCKEDEKDVYLYYVLKVHGCGRSIIFCTSIAALRRISAILQILEISAIPLHAQMQQKQRLKAMDRFRSEENSVLIATDVAARGLDIPGIRTIIHYQLPHSAEVYVHRSGRTARAEMDGCSIVLVSPSEQFKFSALCHALSRKDGLMNFPVNDAYVPAIRRRVSCAVRLDKAYRQLSQAKAKKSWLTRHARELELDLEDEEDVLDTKHTRGLDTNSLQQELHQLLKEPLEPKIFSRRYITGTGISPLLAKQLQNASKPASKKRLSVIGQEEIEPLLALRQAKSRG